MAISVGIIGASGFTGAELLRLLLGHPDFDIKAITSDSLAGSALSDVYPGMYGRTELRYSSHGDSRIFDCDAVFLAVPHTAALRFAPMLIDAGVSVFDLSADYRLEDPHVYEAWYGAAHTSPDLLARAVFGLPELFAEGLLDAQTRREQGEAVLIACAGCYPTASSLAAFPAIREGLVDPPIVIDALSGVSGAGKTPSERTHFCFADENVEAYGVGSHRHTPEIEQILGLPGKVVFTPHLAPLKRGLLATVYLPPTAGGPRPGLDEMHALYSAFYRDSPFVKVLDEGKLPRTDAVARTNYAHIGLACQKATGMLIAVSAIDNLCKGAAGQAIQCANIVFDLPEESGLGAPGAYI